MMLHSDRASMWQIVTNSVFHDVQNTLELRHFIREKVENKEIKPKYMNMDEQLEDFLLKAVPRSKLSDALSKLGIVDIYAPARGGVLRVGFIYNSEKIWSIL